MQVWDKQFLGSELTGVSATVEAYSQLGKLQKSCKWTGGPAIVPVAFFLESRRPRMSAIGDKADIGATLRNCWRLFSEQPSVNLYFFSVKRLRRRLGRKWRGFIGVLW